MVWTIAKAHYAQLFVFGFLLFLGFAQITAPYQNRVQQRSALLVGLASRPGGSLPCWAAWASYR